MSLRDILPRLTGKATIAEEGLSAAEVAEVMTATYARGDSLMKWFVSVHFAVAVLLAFFHHTWFVTFTVGTAGLLIFFVSVVLLPGSFVTRVNAGIALQTFVALHIYQLHGMPEMHFFFFTAFTMMIVYQDWLSMWPGTLLIIGQHILFAILQNSGAPLYFFPESYVGFTKLFFHFGIALAQVGICGGWAHLLRQQTLRDAGQKKIQLNTQQILEEDILHRQNAEQALRESEERVRLVVDTALDAVITITEESRISGWNRQAELTFGWTQAEVLGHELESVIIPHRYRESHRAGVRRFIETREGPILNRRIEITALNRDGNEFPVELAISPLQMGGKFHFSAFVRDISDRKRAEAEREELHRQLLQTSRRVGMADVASSVLHNVGNVLNSVNVSAGMVSGWLRTSWSSDLERISRMLESNSTDLGNYLANDAKGRQIPGFLATLSSHAKSQQERASEEMRSLTEQLEHIRQIIVMQQGLAKCGGVNEPVNLEHVMEQALEINLAGLDRHGIEVVREYAPVPVVVCDRHQVLQILVNLVSNAKYAMSRLDGEHKLTLHIGPDECGGDFVKVQVADTGIGILTENMTRIFAQGFTTKRDGHGFGLHSAALAARTMNGSLSVHSDGEGKGATFLLQLPCQKEPVAA